MGLDHEDGLVNYWCLHWNCNLKSKDGDTCVRTGILDEDTICTRYIWSNHVLVDSRVDISSSELLFYDNEITFQFYTRHDTKQYFKVEKCGVHLMFARRREEVVDGSSPISEDEDVLSLENAHDNCEEEDELIKVPDPGHHTTPRTSDTEGPTVGTSDTKGSEPEARSGTPVRHRRVRFALPRQPPTGDNSRGGVGGHTENCWDCKFADVIDDVRDLREDAAERERENEKDVVIHRRRRPLPVDAATCSDRPPDPVNAAPLP
ncbi:hypothetical protein LWI28_000416 [Acer negundo]|uniref:Uncharacterized protein n=1 Tax=Acer negundo TaxID=4023 RepID=A0AAD5IC89_ACENE|nr:hypothetical protein LWI28_000416 [Acer negundo]